MLCCMRSPLNRPAIPATQSHPRIVAQLPTVVWLPCIVLHMNRVAMKNQVIPKRRNLPIQNEFQPAVIVRSGRREHFNQHHRVSTNILNPGMRSHRTANHGNIGIKLLAMRGPDSQIGIDRETPSPYKLRTQVQENL